MDYAKEALRLHAKWNGKLETVPKMKIENKDDLSIAYTPGVAAPCLEIEKDKKIVTYIREDLIRLPLLVMVVLFWD